MCKARFYTETINEFLIVFISCTTCPRSSLTSYFSTATFFENISIRTSFKGSSEESISVLKSEITEIRLLYVYFLEKWQIINMVPTFIIISNLMFQAYFFVVPIRNFTSCYTHGCWFPHSYLFCFFLSTHVKLKIIIPIPFNFIVWMINFVSKLKMLFYCCHSD